MVHIVFEQANVAVLKKSFELDPSMEGEIVLIQDDYAVGPIKALHTEEGRAERLQWWRELLAGTQQEGIADDGHVRDYDDVEELKRKLVDNADEIVWIWAAQNKHDVSGYYWFMSQFKNYQGRIFILYLNNLPFINEKGNIFYPTSLFQILPREFVKAKKLARVITLSEFEVDPDEWLKLAAEDGGVRLLEGGKKLGQKKYDFYDQEILRYVTAEWMKASKAVNQFMSKAKETTGDVFVHWRIRQMINNGELLAQGESRNPKEYEIRLPIETAVPVN